MTDDTTHQTFEVELETRGDVTCEDVLAALQHHSLAYKVRKVERGDPLEAPAGHDIAWGDG